MLSDGQRFRLEKEKENLDQQYETQIGLIGKIEYALSIENDVLCKFKYQNQIKEGKNNLKNLTDRLDEIENQLRLNSSTFTSSKSKKIKEENEVSKKSFEELTTYKYAQRVSLQEKAITTAREARDFLVKAESEINNNYISKMDFTLILPHTLARQVEECSIFRSNKIKDYKIRFEPDVKASTKSIISILKKENENFDGSELLKDLLEAKTFSDFLKTLENLEVIAWQIF